MFIGRKYELKIIEQAIVSKRAELGIVYGRRRIGKSTLLKQAAPKKKTLYFEALQGVSLKKQIEHFTYQLSKQTSTPIILARNWHEAFDALTLHIKKRRYYIVFDEFPWMAAGRSELVALFKYYWDNHWKQNPNLTAVICGSVASFILNHIVHSKALHNRKTFEISLQPLSANESKLFFKNLRSEHEICKFLIVFGGIPKYLEQIDPHTSFENNIDQLCFQKNGFFINEFETIFKEQFKVIKTYEKITRELARKNCSKEELSQKLNLGSGGGLTDYLKTLEKANFVKIFSPVSPLIRQDVKTKKNVLWDEWLRFYFRYMEPNKKIIEMNTTPGLFNKVAGKSLDTFFGLSFEQLCMKNLPALLGSIGFDMHQIINFGPFFRQRGRGKNKEEGLQIDILLHRKGQILTLFECKYSTKPIGTAVISEVERKIRFLKAPRSFTVERVLITGSGITPALQKSDYFHHILGVEDLFKPSR
jgi:AAA+ ATPase superfamily predicted ATPase